MAQRAEQQASGVPCGIMDQLTAAAGIEGHALLIDCHDLSITPVPVPADVDVVVVHSGLPRSLAGSAYAERRRECEAAEAEIGPLRLAAPGDERALDDPALRRRARHVISENHRVRDTAAALEQHDLRALGELMAASHASLRDDFEVSVDAVDALVERLTATDGVHGARMTGGGFGGCVVAITGAGVATESNLGPERAWVVRASGGARLLS
jgi:galactokinase